MVGAVDRSQPGIDGMTVEALGAWLRDHWSEAKSRLLDGTYEPQPVRRVEIPKASGGVRPLGVPTVLDRFIQQAVMQVMQVLQGGWDGVSRMRATGFGPLTRCLTPSSPGLVSPLFGTLRLLESVEPPCTDPYARWCRRGGAVRLHPYPDFSHSPGGAS